MLELNRTCLFAPGNHPRKVKDELSLNEFEIYRTETSALVWSGSAVIGIFSIVLALAPPPRWLPFAGFGYSLVGIWIPLAMTYRVRTQPGGSLVDH